MIGILFELGTNAAFSIQNGLNSRIICRYFFCNSDDSFAVDHRHFFANAVVASQVDGQKVVGARILILLNSSADVGVLLKVSCGINHSILTNGI